MYYRRPDSSRSPDLGDAAALSVGIRYSGIVRTKICQNAFNANQRPNRHFSLLNVNFAGACGYDFVCDGRRLVRAYLRRRRGAI